MHNYIIVGLNVNNFYQKILNLSYIIKIKQIKTNLKMEAECPSIARWRKRPQRSTEEFHNSLQICQRKFRHYLANIYILNHCALKIQHWFFSIPRKFPSLLLEDQISGEVKLSDSPIYNPKDQLSQPSLSKPTKQNFQAPKTARESLSYYGKENIEVSKDRPQKPCQGILVEKQLNMASIMPRRIGPSFNSVHHINPAPIQRMKIDLFSVKQKCPSKGQQRKVSPNTHMQNTKANPIIPKYSPRTRSPPSNAEIHSKNLKLGFNIDKIFAYNKPKNDSRKLIKKKVTEIVTSKAPFTARSLSPSQHLNAIISKNTIKAQNSLPKRQVNIQINNQTVAPEKVSSRCVPSGGLKKVRRRREERNKSKKHNYCASEQVSLESIQTQMTPLDPVKIPPLAKKQIREVVLATKKGRDQFAKNQTESSLSKLSSILF